ncbi:MAG: hypothetical protein NWE90_07250 [Candidatus Bathyarchaeota archaeon]|nr:hypothetical protein [Candidatus Bathyarchaeota archaeon]
MNRSPIQQHTSAIIKGFIAEVNALKNLGHQVLKGRLRELFTSRILSKFLTSQFGIGTGVIINQRGEQSKELDIVIYDRRILPPFIEEQKIGIYPAECVLAVIEVRSWISKKIIKEYSDSATKLYDETYNPNSSLYRDYQKMRPFYNLVGFYHKGIFKNESREQILRWMMNNAKPLFGVCLVNKLSWLSVVRPEGSLKMVDEYNEETKAFIAVLLDNIRTFSQRRYLSLVNHVDWLGIYTRDQGGIRKIFEQRNASKGVC